MNTLNALQQWIIRDARRRDEQAWDAEQEKAVQWYQEQLNATNWTDFEISLFELMEICCHELESHIRKADPRTPEQIDADQDAAEWGETYASLLP
jgi:hypothetical protein